MYWEELRPCAHHAAFHYAVLDFDGTISLVREGWQAIMIGYFTEELHKTPEGLQTDGETLKKQAREMIFFHTGKQTIYQCIALAEIIERMGGKPLDPQAYKDEYSRRLLITIDGRLKGLADGSIDPETLTVPGTRELLTMLQDNGVALYLASGTDEEYVRSEVALLGLLPFFKGHVYGAQQDYRTFSKKMVIEKLIADNHLAGDELLGFGDGYVEIENIREVGGYAIGVASNETARQGIDAWKRERLIKAGADVIIPDYREIDTLRTRLFPRNGKG